MSDITPEQQAAEIAQKARRIVSFGRAMEKPHQELDAEILQKTGLVELVTHAEIGREWRSDSSLEKWFPFTAEELVKLRAELALAKIPTTVDAVEREEWRQACKAFQTALATAQAEVNELRKRLDGALATIEADAAACDKESAEQKAKKDELNSYLMSTQAMAHRLDIARINKAMKETR